jgi:hypothetical protein
MTGAPPRPAGLDIGSPSLKGRRFDTSGFFPLGLGGGDALRLLLARVLGQSGLQSAGFGAGVIKVPNLDVANCDS